MASLQAVLALLHATHLHSESREFYKLGKLLGSAVQMASSLRTDAPKQRLPLVGKLLTTTNNNNDSDECRLTHNGRCHLVHMILNGFNTKSLKRSSCCFMDLPLGL